MIFLVKLLKTKDQIVISAFKSKHFWSHFLVKFSLLEFYEIITRKVRKCRTSPRESIDDVIVRSCHQIDAVLM